MDHSHTWDPQARRGRRRSLLLMVAVLVGGAVLATILAVTLPASGIFSGDSGFWNGDPSTWAGIVGLTICAAGLVTALASVWWLARDGAFRRNARSPLWAQSWSRRRHLARQVLGKVAPRDEDRPLLPKVAERLIEQPKLTLPLYGLALFQVGQAFLQWAPAFVLIAALFLVGLASTTVATLRNARRARAFLAAYADDSAAEARASTDGEGA